LFNFKRSFLVYIIILIPLLVLGCASASDNSQQFAEKLLIIDSDITNEINKFASTVATIDSDKIQEYLDNPEAAKPNTDNINDILIKLKNSKDQITQLKPPKNMEIKKEAYLNNLNKVIAGVTNYLNGLTALQIKDLDSSINSINNGTQDLKNGVVGLKEIRTELNTIKDSGNN